MKTYSLLEMSKATELECFKCGKKEKTDPNSNKMPKGWKKERRYRNEIVCFCSDCR